MSKAVVHIIGAGISGLGSAHFLKKSGVPSVIYEASGRPGGRAGYFRWNSGFFETGGKNFADSWSDFMEIRKDLNVTAYGPQHQSFHLLLDAKLIKFDKRMGFKEILNMMKYVGVIGSLQLNKMIRYKLKNSNRLNFDEGLIVDLEEAYDHAPVTAHFEKKLCKGPLRMFSIIGGGAEPSETYYSNLMHLLPFGVGRLNTFTEGIGHFFEILEKNHTIHFNTTVSEIVIKNSVLTGLVVNNGMEKRFIKTDNVICSLPLNRLVKLINFPENVEKAINAVRYFPVALINAEYEENVFDDKCQSIMFDENYHLGHCSANRSYKLNSVRFTISGRKGRSVLHLSDPELIKLAEEEFSQILPIRSPRVRYHVQRHLDGVCSYGPKYSKVRKIISDYIKGIRGLEVAGDYLEGHNMGGCSTSAKKAANRVVERLSYLA